MHADQHRQNFCIDTIGVACAGLLSVGKFSQRGPTVTKTCGGDRRGYHASGLGARAATAPKGVIESQTHGSSSVGATWPKPSRHSGSSRGAATVILSDNAERIRAEIKP